MLGIFAFDATVSPDAVEVVTSDPDNVGSGYAYIDVYKVTGDGGLVAPERFGPYSYGGYQLTLAGGVGFYFVQAVDEFVNQTSPLFYVQVSNAIDAPDAEATKAREAVKNRIQLLTLEGIGPNVYIQLTPTQVNVKFPCVIVTPWALSEDNPTNLSGLDDWGHPNWVWICDRKPPTLHKELARIERWRQAIRRAFHNQQLRDPSSCVRCVVETADIVDPRLPQYQFVVSQMVVRVYTREPRGLGA